VTRDEREAKLIELVALSEAMGGYREVGSHAAQLELLADRYGRTLDDVTELWNERAALREHIGGQSRAYAELDALVDVEAWLRTHR
jgi:hypothetical protein